MATNRIKLEEVINQAKEVLESANPDYVIALCRYIFRYYPRALEATRRLTFAWLARSFGIDSTMWDRGRAALEGAAADLATIAER